MLMLPFCNMTCWPLTQVIRHANDSIVNCVHIGGYFARLGAVALSGVTLSVELLMYTYTVKYSTLLKLAQCCGSVDNKWLFHRAARQQPWLPKSVKGYHNTSIITAMSTTRNWHTLGT